MRIAISLVSLVAPVWLTGLASVALAGPAPSGPRAQAPAAQRPGTVQPSAAAPAALPPRPLVQLAPIDLATVPESCRTLARQALGPNLPTALSARISLASCMSEQAIAPLALCDCGESIAAIDTAVAPAIAILDDVISNADLATQVIAEHTEGQLYAGFAQRLIATLPKVGAEATEAEVSLREMRRQTLEAQLGPWRETAMTSFQHAVELVKLHRELAANPTVMSAARDSEQRLAAAAIATR
jgi:hypothetical protein